MTTTAYMKVPVTDLRIGDIILPPERELRLWMRRHVHDHQLSEDALRLTITEIREGTCDARGAWVIITTQQDPAWGARFPFSFKTRPCTAWPRQERTS